MTNLPNHLDMEALLRSNKPKDEGAAREFDTYVGIAFSANWCGPCRRLDKSAIAKATPNIKWYYVDVDENQTSLGYCGLRGIPSFSLIYDGKYVDGKTGFGSVDDVLEWVASYNFPVQRK